MPASEMNLVVAGGLLPRAMLAAESGGGAVNATRIADWAHAALLREVELSPKPGLVDRFNNGAHRDMDIETFRASAAAIAPWFATFCMLGLSECRLPAAEFLPRLRAEGMRAEREMFRAAHGVNTHKGSIFALGLLCAAAGRLGGRGEVLTAEALCGEVAVLCAGLVKRELGSTHEAGTAGELLYQRYGLDGARGEAASGFATARHWGLAPYLAALRAGHTEEAALHAALLNLMANNEDTNLVARGGLSGLAYVQRRAQAMLEGGRIVSADYLSELAAFDVALIERNLSPGGSADLLAVSWFLACFAQA